MANFEQHTECLGDFIRDIREGRKPTPYRWRVPLDESGRLLNAVSVGIPIPRIVLSWREDKYVAGELTASTLWHSLVDGSFGLFIDVETDALHRRVVVEPNTPDRGGAIPVAVLFDVARMGEEVIRLRSEGRRPLANRLEHVSNAFWRYPVTTIRLATDDEMIVDLVKRSTPRS